MSEFKVGDWVKDIDNPQDNDCYRIRKIENDLFDFDQVFDTIKTKRYTRFTKYSPNFELSEVRKLTKIELILYGLENE